MRVDGADVVWAVWLVATLLDGGTVPTSEATVHVHCASRGLPRPPLRPIFEPGRVTVQPFMVGEGDIDHLGGHAGNRFQDVAPVHRVLAHDGEGDIRGVVEAGL